MRLKLGGVKCCRRDREFRQGRLEVQRFGYLIVDVLRGELDHGPLTFSLALHAYDSTVRQSAAYIDAVLALAQESVSNGVVVVPNPAEEIGANILEFIPALGNQAARMWQSSASRSVLRGACPGATAVAHAQHFNAEFGREDCLRRSPSVLKPKVGKSTENTRGWALVHQSAERE